MTHFQSTEQGRSDRQYVTQENRTKKAAAKYYFFSLTLGSLALVEAMIPCKELKLVPTPT